MYETKVKFLNGAAFQVEARGHKLVCDQPQSNGGADQGMTPPELLLASVGTCAGYYAVQYLNARKLSADGLAIRVSAEKVMHPARLGPIRVDVESAASEDPRHRDGLVRAVEKCLIHATLAQPSAIEVNVAPALAPI